MAKDNEEMLMIHMCISSDLFSEIDNLSPVEFNELGVMVCENINNINIDIKAGKLEAGKHHKLNFVKDFTDKSVFVSIEFDICEKTIEKKCDMNCCHAEIMDLVIINPEKDTYCKGCENIETKVACRADCERVNLFLDRLLQKKKEQGMDVVAREFNHMCNH